MSRDTTADSAAALVLVIDDDDTSRYIMASWLRRAGHTVVEAADGAQGLALLAGASAPEQPELAVVDVNLPDMSGFEVCERIKADPLAAHLPVIHVSASAIDVSDRAQGLYRGADAYLTEPIAPAEFLATVTAALRYARARLRAERLAARIAALNRATLALYAAADGAEFATAAANGAAALMDAPAVAVALETAGGRAHLAVSAPGTPGDVLDGSPAPLDLLAGASLGGAIGSAIDVLPLTHWPELARCEGFAAQSEFALILARTKRGRPPVALAVPARALGGGDRDLFTQLAQTCALALEAQRSFSEEHGLALTLQRTFLPDRLPSLAQVDMTVRYVPAAKHTEIGGDFYEAVETGAGLLLAIGDVAGHSLGAAVVMGELRHALRAYAIEDHPPHVLLERLDAYLLRLCPGTTVTVCLVLVEPGGRRVQVANAGHIPPLLRHPDGSTRYLTEHGTLLGLGETHAPACGHEVAAGSTLLLLTDGLIEVPGTRLDESLAELAREVADAPRDLDPLCDRLLARHGRDKRDDIALLAVRLD
ncbi:fused response regulator/phosphatase [Kitasatospora mediocidica]|uniref:fused response regulator/phosphatase n=1 Tax=Kitasatospora mediocidica TaxID=58352 RepID=UPI000560B33B|nr:fused response regulator/phosphatase [Kitasatospora mediocidica]